LGYACNLSFFFLQRNALENNNEEFQLQRYLANEINGEYRIKNNRKIQFNYWHSIRMDKLGIEGEDFLNLVYSMEGIPLGSKAQLAFRPSVFYLFDVATLEGLFISQTSNFQMNSWKWNLFLQTALPIHVTPKQNLIWNFGLNLPF